MCVVDNGDIRYLCQVISGPDQSQTETLPALHHLRSTGKQLADVCIFIMSVAGVGLATTSGS